MITSSLFSRTNNLCSVCAARRRDWKDDIYSQLTPGANANLTNSDQCQWFNDAWQIARVFMGLGREASTAGCGDTIELVLNCKLFDSSISNRQSFERASSAIYVLLNDVFMLINDRVCRYTMVMFYCYHFMSLYMYILIAHPSNCSIFVYVLYSQNTNYHIESIRVMFKHPSTRPLLLYKRNDMT